MRTPHALRTRRRTAAAARSTARCSPQAPLRSALRSSKPEGGVRPGSSCQSPSAYAPHCFRKARKPVLTLLVSTVGQARRTQPGRRSRTEPALASSRRHLAAARRADAPAQPSRPPTHARSTASMGLAPFPTRGDRGGRGGTGCGPASARAPPPRGLRQPMAPRGRCHWRSSALCNCPALPLWLRAAHAEPKAACLHPDSPAGDRGRPNTEPCGKTTKPLEGRKQIASHRNAYGLQGNEAAGAESPHRSRKRTTSVRAVCVYC